MSTGSDSFPAASSAGSAGGSLVVSTDSVVVVVDSCSSAVVAVASFGAVTESLQPASKRTIPTNNQCHHFTRSSFPYDPERPQLELVRPNTAPSSHQAIGVDTLRVKGTSPDPKAVIDLREEPAWDDFAPYSQN